MEAISHQSFNSLDIIRNLSFQITEYYEELFFSLNLLYVFRIRILLALCNDSLEDEEIDYTDKSQRTHQQNLYKQLAIRFNRRHSRTQRRHNETFQTKSREEISCLKHIVE